MNWEALGAIAELVGAIAVIATLVYLAIQIRQNTASVKANAHQTWATTVIAEQSAGLQDNTSKAISIGLFNPANLDEENWVTFANYCNLFMHKAESAYFMQKSKIIDSSVSDKELERAATFITSEGPSQWWKAGARTQFTDEFVKHLEHLVDSPRKMEVYDFTPGRGFHSRAEND